jgi:hypothetical protein
MTLNNKKTLNEIIEQFNTEANTHSRQGPTPQPTEPCAPIDEHSYTYVGEHYDTIPRDAHWTKQFASTEFAVNVTEAISYAVRDGLDNSDVAAVLGKILSEVKRR